MKTRLEYSDEKSNKFWEIETKGATHTIRFGRLGTKGQTKTKSFGSKGEAEQSAGKLVQQKLKQGYRDPAAERRRMLERSLQWQDGQKLKGKALRTFLSDRIPAQQNKYLADFELDEKKRMLCFDGSLTLKKDLLLKGKALTDVAGVIVAGRLEVQGDIVGEKAGVALIVGDRLEARHIITRGADIHLRGDAAVEGIVVIGKNGSVQCDQTTHADFALLDCGDTEDRLGTGDFVCRTLMDTGEIGGAFNQQGDFTGQRIHSRSRVTAMLSPELLDAKRAKIDARAVVKHLRADQAITIVGEPARPAGVDRKATWNDELFQWELGRCDEKTAGERKIWQLPGGNLARRETAVRERGKIRYSVETYHPDGVLAESETLVGGERVERVFNRTRGEQADGFCIPYYLDNSEEVQRATIQYPSKRVTYLHWDGSEHDGGTTTW